MGDDLQSEILHRLGMDRTCACGLRHVVETRRVRWDDRAGSAAVQEINTIRQGRTVLLVCDPNTKRAAGEALNAALRSASIDTIEHVIKPHARPILVADESHGSMLADAIDDARPGCVVGVGSGTINDLCKYAASIRDVPYLAYPTAASMNGYTSTVAALKREGLKITEPVKAPIAVIVDVELLRRSPPAMTAAGVADLLSKFVCNADWMLSRLVVGGYYCDVPAELSSRAVAAVVANLDDIAAGRADGPATLIAALLLSGMAMAMVGNSSPASGAEHLVSHYWDMRTPDPDGRRLHGAQVGLGTLLTATLYEKLLRMDPESINPDATAEKVSSLDTLERGIHHHFGSAANAVAEQARRKHLTADKARQRCARIKDRWDDIRSAVAPMLRTRRQVAELLRRAGAPTTLTQIGLTDEDALSALQWARHIRDRYTVFDLAAEIGCFDDIDRRNLLLESGVGSNATIG